MIRGGSDGWLARARSRTIAAGIGVIALFVRHEARTAEPMLDLSVFRNPRFAGASIAVTAVYFCLFGTIFLLTQHLQELLGYGTLAAGIRTVPFAAVLIVVANLTPRIVGRFGPRLPIVVGLLVVAVSQLLRIASTPDSGYGIILASQMTFAAGMGLLIAPATASIMGVGARGARRGGLGHQRHHPPGRRRARGRGDGQRRRRRVPQRPRAPGAVGAVGRASSSLGAAVQTARSLGTDAANASRRRRAPRVHPRAPARILRRLRDRARRRGAGLAHAAGWRRARHPLQSNRSRARTKPRRPRDHDDRCCHAASDQVRDAPEPGIADLLGFELTRVQPGPRGVRARDA